MYENMLSFGMNFRPEVISFISHLFDGTLDQITFVLSKY